jgi:uncharacterized protein
MGFVYRKHKNGADIILAVADKDIIGKKYEEGDLVLDVTREFYSGSEAAADEIVEFARKSDIINAVGNEIIKVLIDEDLVDKNMVLKIEGVSHAQVIRI